MAEILPAPQPGGTLRPSGGIAAVTRSGMARPTSTSAATPRPTPPQPGPPGPAHRHGARPADPAREGLPRPAELARRLGGRSTPPPSPPWTPRAGEVFKERPGAAPLPRIDGRTGARRVPHRGRGLRQQGREHLEGRAQRQGAVRPGQGPPRFRRAEGQDLRRPAGQAAGRESRRLAAATAPYGGEGTYLSVADITGPESLAKVRATKRALKAKAHAPSVSAGPDLSGRRLYLCTPDRPDLADFVAACIAAASTWSSCGTSSSRRGRCWHAPPGGRRLPRPRGPLRAQRPPRPGARGRGRRGPRRPGRRPGRAGAAHPGSRRHHRAVHPLAETWRLRRPRTSPTSRPDRWRRRRPSPAAPGRASTTSVGPVHAPLFPSS